MGLVRVRADRHAAARVDLEPGCLLDVPDGVAALVLAARGVDGTGPWLRVGPDYPAALAARDLAALAWVIDVTDAVVEGPDALDQARVVRALLSEDAVSMESPVATLVEAYNRPTPPHAIAVWAWVEGELRDGERTLAPGPTRHGRTPWVEVD